VEEITEKIWIHFVAPRKLMVNPRAKADMMEVKVRYLRTETEDIK
jgi:hypothetical protein